MLKINKKVEYALMALKFLADKSQNQGPHILTSAREICDQFDMPFDTTAKVMQLMNTHGILKSSKGIKGGYFLSKDLREISYMNLVRLIEGKELGRICVTSKGTCELINKCNIITPVELLNKKLSHFLEDLTLADILLADQVQGQTNAKTQMSSTVPLFPFILNPDSILPPSLAPKYTREVK